MAGFKVITEGIGVRLFDGHRKMIGKVSRMRPIALRDLRQRFQRDAKFFMKELHLLLLGLQKLLPKMAEHIIEQHEPGLNLSVAFAASVLRVFLAEDAVDPFRLQVVDVPSMFILDGADMLQADRLGK